MKKLSSLISNIASSKIIGNTEIDIVNIQSDSRQVIVGTLFVAVVGTVSDGHDYIETAITQGAIAIICQTLPKTKHEQVTYIQVANSAEALGIVAAQWYDNPSHQITLTGVTGTNGKTTTATLLYELFISLGYKVGLLSTVCNYINRNAIEATHTTPDPLTLNKLLAEMVEVGCQYAFMEVSSHAVAQYRIAGLQFTGGIFTNLTRDHLDYHGTVENYLKAKKMFFDQLPQQAWALTNSDDKTGDVMLQNCKASKNTYSIRNMATFKTKIIESHLDGMTLLMNEHEVVVPFVGRFNASNLTAVFGAAILLGQTEEEVLVHLSALKAVPGRFETIHTPAGFIAIIDYAHTPDALNNMLTIINEVRNQQGQLITVVGCGGNRDKGKRPLMAKEAVDGSDRVILTSDNPRDESPQAILDDMLAGLDVVEKRKALVIGDRREAIRTACALAKANDVILIAGKGHENYQIIRGVKHHFDDKEEVLAVVNAL